MRFYFVEARGARGWIALMSCSAILSTAIEGALPLVFALVADRLAAGDQSFSDFIPLLVAMVVGGIAVRFFWSLETYALEKSSIVVQRNISQKVFDHLAHRSLGFHSERLSGSLVADASKIGRNFENILMFFNDDILGISVYLLAMFVVIAFQIPWLLPILVLAVIFSLLLGWRIRRTEVDPAQEASQSDSLVSAHLADALANIETVISSGQSERELEHYRQKVDEWEQDSTIFLRKRVRNMTLLNAAPFLVTAPLLFLGVFLVAENYFSVGDLVLIMIYGQGVISRANYTQMSFTRAIESLSQAAPMVDILSTEIKTVNSPAQNIVLHSGAIELRSVDFAYPEHDPLFRDFSLRIQPRERVGIVGASGAGKSSLFRLLLRLLEPDSGEILFDGQNTSHFDANSLRRQISYVAQEPLLFHRSITENIAYGINASAEEIRQAARAAYANGFIEKLPHGYDSLVGDRGVKLSGGERQRIVLARAFLQNNPVLLLDEPTSSLDLRSEELIGASTEKLFRGKTALVIAHRLSTIAHLDRIIVLRQGQIAEEGSHKELLDLGGEYADLWRRQSQGFLP